MNPFQHCYFILVTKDFFCLCWWNSPNFDFFVVEPQKVSIELSLPFGSFLSSFPNCHFTLLYSINIFPLLKLDELSFIFSILHLACCCTKTRDIPNDPFPLTLYRTYCQHISMSFPSCLIENDLHISPIHNWAGLTPITNPKLRISSLYYQLGFYGMVHVGTDLLLNWEINYFQSQNVLVFWFEKYFNTMIYNSAYHQSKSQDHFLTVSMRILKNFQQPRLMSPLCQDKVALHQCIYPPSSLFSFFSLLFWHHPYYNCCTEHMMKNISSLNECPRASHQITMENLPPSTN